ncbi:hypothetical protein HS088_TW19G00433 [Tripterygium wilfordii]|uniref:F-box domain-containing protein n=1 Tax=Tripterygium wilfordii TaxID=458696 RepID=A0A7J7C9M4_TRIWF|nr:hypothetical protein HS088_TW19G00433 [Tripterygium wilfordii]
MATIFTLPPEIIQTHILIRLDGPTLAMASCISSQFRALCNEEKFWQQICSATWTSSENSSVRQIISTFSGGHRSFFLDSFLQLSHGQPLKFNLDRSLGTSRLISAVDIYYKDKPIFSGVKETCTTTSTKFLYSPFQVDLHDPKDTVSTPIQHTGQMDTWLKHLEENLSLSWIILGLGMKRAANMSTRRPVFIRWPCNTAGVVQLHYTTIMAGDGRAGSKVELVKCKLVVTCSGVDEGEVKVEEVSMQMKDMEGRRLNGRDSLVILLEALENGTRKKSKREEMKEMYEDYVKRKKERKEMKRRRERVMDIVCDPFFVCIATWIIVFFFLLIIY